MVELLAPARDFTALEAALKNGANAVYIGVENYNMRSHAPNFTMKKLKEASDRCHSQNARLYVCTNTVMNNRDIEHLNTILPDIVSAGADAIIASDWGFSTLHRMKILMFISVFREIYLILNP